MKTCANCGNEYGVMDGITLCDGNIVCTKCCHDIIDRNEDFKSQINNFLLNLSVINLAEFKKMYADPKLSSKCDTNGKIIVSPFRKKNAKQEFYFLRKKLWISYMNKEVKTTVLVDDNGLDITEVTEVTSAVNRSVENYYLPIECICEYKSRIKMAKLPLVLIAGIFILYRIDIWAILLSLLLLCWSYGNEIVLKTTNGDTYKIPVKLKTDETEQLLETIKKLKSNDKESAEETVPESRKSGFCTTCGTPVSLNENFCKQCGAKIKDAEMNRKKVKQMKKPGTGTIMIGFICTMIVIGFIISVTVSVSNQNSEILEQLNSFTSFQDDAGIYRFYYGSKWFIQYSDVSTAVRIEEPEVYYCMSEWLGMEDIGNDFTFAHNLGDDCIHMYFDVELPEEGKLSILTYDLKKEEYILMIDGEKYTPSDEFKEYLDKYGLKDILLNDVEDFENDLSDFQLTVSDVKSLNYRDIEKWLN